MPELPNNRNWKSNVWKEMKAALIHIALTVGTVLLWMAGAGAQTSQHAAASDLEGTSWQLVKFQGGDGISLVPSYKDKYTIEFAGDGRVSVRIDCNQGAGSWKSPEPGKVELTPLALTRAMCPAAPLNDRMPRDWEYVRSYIVKDGDLFLSLMADGGTYEFEPLREGKTAGGQTISGLPASFVGTLPCADCPGIVYQVNLFSDHTFASRMKYQERAGRFDDHGRWELSRGTLVLHGRKETETKFALHDAETLRKLDANGREIESKLNYDLKRTPKFKPFESTSRK